MAEHECKYRLSIVPSIDEAGARCECGCELAHKDIERILNAYPAQRREVERAMDALFPNGWKEGDAEALGATVEGVCEVVNSHAALVEACKSALYRLEQYDYQAMGPTIAKLKSALEAAKGGG